MLKRTIVLLLAISLAISCKPTQYGFRTKDIKSAQRLYGLEFDKTGIDTMYHYLGRNKRGYENLREYQVDNETFPALTFNPHPAGFEMPTGQQQILQYQH